MSYFDEVNVDELKNEIKSLSDEQFFRIGKEAGLLKKSSEGNGVQDKIKISYSLSLLSEEWSQEAEIALRNRDGG